jgi:hypothetical protein
MCWTERGTGKSCWRVVGFGPAEWGIMEGGF